MIHELGVSGVGEVKKGGKHLCQKMSSGKERPEGETRQRTPGIGEARRERRLTRKETAYDPDEVVPANRRGCLESLCRYSARPPLATERLSSDEQGRILFIEEPEEVNASMLDFVGEAAGR